MQHVASHWKFLKVIFFENFGNYNALIQDDLFGLDVKFYDSADGALFLFFPDGKIKIEIYSQSLPSNYLEQIRNMMNVLKNEGNFKIENLSSGSIGPGRGFKITFMKGNSNDQNGKAIRNIISLMNGNN